GGELEVWLYTPGATASESQWAQVTLEWDPPATQASRDINLAYDPYRDRILRFGGKLDNGPYDNATSLYEWDWNSSHWRLTESFPYVYGSGGHDVSWGRRDPGGAYDLNRDTLVIYGGWQLTLEYDNDGKPYVKATDFHDTWEDKTQNPG